MISFSKTLGTVVVWYAKVQLCFDVSAWSIVERIWVGFRARHLQGGIGARLN